MTKISNQPTVQKDRITNLDTVRGFATLGILGMNALYFGMLKPAYNNVNAPGTDNVLDWVFAIAGEIFIDQKTMAIFSMLFGAGIVLFADRAEMKGKKPVRLSLWRNLLLVAIGFFHSLLWEGDILIIYGLCAPVLLCVRKKSQRFLVSTGCLLFSLTIIFGVFTQLSVNDGNAYLGDFWSGSEAMGDEVTTWFIFDVFCRALGAMLIGVAMFRSGFISGILSIDVYKKAAKWGFSLGIPLVIFGVIIQSIMDYDSNIAILGQLPNTAGTIPLAIGYISLIALWDRKPVSSFKVRIRSVGQMALTNYLSQTIIGVLLFSTVFDKGDVGRSGTFLFMICVWAVQIFWSKPWLSYFRFGPIEWAWRCMTYRKIQNLRR